MGYFRHTTCLNSLCSSHLRCAQSNPDCLVHTGQPHISQGESPFLGEKNDIYSEGMTGGFWKTRVIWNDGNNTHLFLWCTQWLTKPRFYEFLATKKTLGAFSIEEPSHAHVAACIDALMRHAVSLGATSSEQKELWVLPPSWIPDTMSMEVIVTLR